MPGPRPAALWLAATFITITSVEAGWRIAIATNGETGQQWAKIRNTGLDGHVDTVAVSQEVGVAKPDRRMFDVAAERCGVRLSDGGWMVGDCALRDISGGRAMGLRWLRFR